MLQYLLVLSNLQNLKCVPVLPTNPGVFQAVSRKRRKPLKSQNHLFWWGANLPIQRVLEEMGKSSDKY